MLVEEDVAVELPADDEVLVVLLEEGGVVGDVVALLAFPPPKSLPMTGTFACGFEFEEFWAATFC